MITAKKQTVHQESNGPETLAMRTYEPQIYHSPSCSRQIFLVCHCRGVHPEMTIEDNFINCSENKMLSCLTLTEKYSEKIWQVRRMTEYIYRL